MMKVSSPPKNVLTALHLQKSYASRQVVHDVSFSVHSGEIVGLLGPNGAGKTTSFYMVVGLVPNDAGQVKYNDFDITAKPMHERARLGIGYLPQEPSVFRKLTVAENILAVLQLRSELTDEEREGKLEKLLAEFHVSHLRDAHGISLSGGERRRVEIARALAMEPKFILLDEPFAGIDPISVFDLKRIIHHLNQKGIGVLITDHNVRETLTICHRAYIVNEGEVLCEGSPHEILADKRVRDVYLGDDFEL
jgi:lipopolysaccharide export system ATP-binding protein